MRKLWTETEDNTLRELVKFYNRKTIARKMNFSLSSIKSHARRLELDFKVKEIRDWTNEEAIKLEELMKAGVTIKDIAVTINRSEASINQFCHKNKLKSRLQPIPWTNDESEVLIKIKEGDKNISSSKIASIMNRSEFIINQKIKELNLQSEKSKTLSLSRDISEDGLKQCYKCKQISEVSNFYKRGNGYKSICKSCSGKRSKLKLTKLSINNDIVFFLQYKLSTAKSRAKKYNMSFNLSIDFLFDLYKQQNGLCFYTNSPMTLNTRCPNSLSLDRIESSKGYVEGNIVLCGFKVNNMKNDLSTSDFVNICELVCKNKDKLINPL